MCLDVGCGVGGPMRTIASTSGAEVTGITINGYQVSRAKHHNTKVGLLRLVGEILCIAVLVHLAAGVTVRGRLLLCLEGHPAMQTLHNRHIFTPAHAHALALLATPESSGLCRWA